MNTYINMYSFMDEEVIGALGALLADAQSQDTTATTATTTMYIYIYIHN